ncbi:MAG: DUF2384 domain-containing protein [Alphaproteobacteria bacterium]|nr:DUF2384 domain-containing protein [Alphaproteobacteria bacterium]
MSRHIPKPPEQSDNEARSVLTKALIRAADFWEFKNNQMAKILGVDESTISRMKAHGRLINPLTKEGELALLFVRAFRSLDAVMGGHIENEKAWLHGYNHVLKGIPATLLQTVTGLNAVVVYLDAIRGH